MASDSNDSSLQSVRNARNAQAPEIEIVVNGQKCPECGNIRGGYMCGQLCGSTDSDSSSSSITPVVLILLAIAAAVAKYYNLI